jgi:hypothetical protein
MDKINTLEKILDRQLAWISRADTRISLVLPLATAMLGSLAALAPKPTNWEILPAILASISAILIVLAMIFSSLACFPRVAGPKSSNIFFNGIAGRETGQYKKIMCEISEDDYLDDICRQCHRNAQIAKAKFEWIQKALASLLISVIPWILTVYLLYKAN